MPDRGEHLDEVRQRLIDAVEDAGTTLATLSRALGRNHAYLHQFVFRGSPKHLSAEARRTLGDILGVEPEVLAPARQPLAAPSSPGSRSGRRPAKRATPETPPTGISLTAFARRLTMARLESGFDTPAAFCTAAGLDRQRFADLEDGVDDPTMEELDRIAEASGKSFDWLIRGPRRPQDAVDPPGAGAGPSAGAPVDRGGTESGNLPVVRASGEDGDSTLKTRSANEERRTENTILPVGDPNRKVR